jgi:hypothetical protein
MGVMYTRGEVDDRLRVSERGTPVSCGADGPDYDFVALVGGLRKARRNDHLLRSTWAQGAGPQNRLLLSPGQGVDGPSCGLSGVFCLVQKFVNQISTADRRSIESKFSRGRHGSFSHRRIWNQRRGTYSVCQIFRHARPYNPAKLFSVTVSIRL